MLLQQLSLIPPTPHYESSYISFCDEWSQTSEPAFSWLQPHAIFRHRNNAPHATTYWFVDGKDVIGAAFVRHKLSLEDLISHGHIEWAVRKAYRKMGYGTELLRQALDKLEDEGVQSALLICDEEDVASQKMLDKNGGIFESPQTDERTGKVRYRYWVRI